MPQNELKVQLNGNQISFHTGDNVLSAVHKLQPDSPFVAVEYNGQILEKSDFEKTFLKNGDILEIIQPLGGGSR